MSNAPAWKFDKNIPAYDHELFQGDPSTQPIDSNDSLGYADFIKFDRRSAAIKIRLSSLNKSCSV